MNPNNHLVIMAGGIGSRFWPMSNEELPKQFLDILGCGKTLIQLTLQRFEDMVPMENVWVVTGERYKDLVYEQLPDVPKKNVLLEPCRRNTAPCICYVSTKIKKRNPRAVVVVTPSDHVILDVPAFKEAINESLAYTSETDAIVTLGIKPNRPETGYGYIKADLGFSSARMKNLYRVDAFKEKPDIDTAKQYIALPEYFWNAGIFVWSVNTIVNAFRVYESQMWKSFEALMPQFDTPKEQKAVNEVYENCKSISVDYAIMEKAEDIFVRPADIGWSDLGTWTSLLMLSDKDVYGNALIGDNIRVFETRNSVVHTTHLREVVVQGLDGYVVVEKDGALLICKLSEEQRIGLFHE